MQSGEDLLARTAVEGNILDRVAKIEAELARMKQQDLQAGTLAEMSSDAGDITAGRFICASSDTTEPTDPAFSGSFMSAAGESFSGDTYHVGGVNEGALQAGFSSTDGKFVAAAGNIVLDNEGMFLYGNNNDITFAYPHTSSDADLIQAHFGPYDTGMRMIFHRNDTPTELLTNGNFATGDFTGWSISGGGAPTKWSVVDMGGGTYRAEYTDSIGVENLYSNSFALARNEVIKVTGKGYDVSIRIVIPGIKTQTISRYFGTGNVEFETWFYGIGTAYIEVENSTTDAWISDFSVSKYRGCSINFTSGMSSTGTAARAGLSDIERITFYRDIGAATYIGVDRTYAGDEPPFTVQTLRSGVAQLPLSPDGICFSAGTAVPAYNTTYNANSNLLYGKDDGNLYIQPVGTTDADKVITDALIAGYTDPSVLSERSVAPTAPASGYRNLYGMSNGLFDQSSGGTISRLVSAAAQLPAPAAVVAGSPTTGGAVTVGTHSYKTTYYDSYGETTPSAKSNVVTVANTTNDRVPLTIPLGPAGTVGRRIYRTVAGDTGDWKLLVEIPDNTTTTYNDDIADAALGAAAPTTNTTADGNGAIKWDKDNTAWYSAGQTQNGTTSGSFSAAGACVVPKVPILVYKIAIDVKNTGTHTLWLGQANNFSNIMDAATETLWTGSTTVGVNDIALSAPILLLPHIGYWIICKRDSGAATWYKVTTTFDGTHYTYKQGVYDTTLYTNAALPISLTYQAVTLGL